MESDEIESWLLNWFRVRDPKLAELNDDELAVVDYFQAGYVDSFGVIDLIQSAEQRFGAQLTDRDLQDRRMSSIRGLAEILLERSRA